MQPSYAGISALGLCVTWPPRLPLRGGSLRLSLDQSSWVPPSLPRSGVPRDSRAPPPTPHLPLTSHNPLALSIPPWCPLPRRLKGHTCPREGAENHHTPSSKVHMLHAWPPPSDWEQITIDMLSCPMIPAAPNALSAIPR